LNHDPVKYEEFKIVSMLADDSEYAFQLIYDRHRDKIYQTALRYLKSPALAQEVVQDVFLKLWFERKNISTDKPVEAWLYTVAKNNVLNRLKKIANEWKATNQLAYLINMESVPASAKAESSDYDKLLEDAVTLMPDQQQKVFNLARSEKLTYVQIGERLHISPLTVKTHMARALQHIRRYFKNKGIELPFILLIIITNIF
jgi:RNA polymerase sigma-70 factor (ECF subfamily)